MTIHIVPGSAQATNLGAARKEAVRGERLLTMNET